MHHERNRKLGGSLKTGFENTRGELVLYTDADLPFDMAEAAKAVRLMRIYQADIVSAYRLDRTGEGLRRLVYSYVYNHLVQLLFGLRRAGHELRVQARASPGLRPHSSLIEARLHVPRGEPGARGRPC